jgi:hypothetical protein
MSGSPRVTKKPETGLKHSQSSSELMTSYAISVAIAVPCLLAAWLMADFHPDWPTARVIIGIIICVSLVNFLALVLIDQFGTKKSHLTMRALLAGCAVVILIVLVVILSRYLPFFDPHWLFPLIVAVIAFKYLALFKEKNLALKFYLGINILALTALWGIDVDNKITLPFF